MADPLSVTASILSVVDAAGKLISLIKKVKNADNIKCALLNEVSELKFVLDLIAGSENPPQDPGPQISALIAKAQSVLSRTEESLNTQPSTVTGKISYRVRIDKLAKHQKEIRSVREQLSTIFVPYTIQSQRRIELEVQELRVDMRIASLNKSLILNGNAVTSQAMSGPSNAANRFEHVPSLRDHTVSIVRQDIENPGRPSRVAGIICFQTSYRALYSCPYPCDCLCHRQRNFCSSEYSRHLYGSLFVGYVGLPVITHTCNSRSCRRRSAPVVRVRYYFPGWFFVRVGWFATCRVDFSSPQFSLKVVRPVPTDADIFHAAACGDAESIMAMFQQKQASPMDIGLGDGRSALHTAVNMGRFNICKLLLNEGADPYLVDNDGVSPTSMAWEKYISLPSQALKIKIESLFPDKSCLDDFNFTSLHQLVIGLRAGDLLSELRRSPCLTDATDAGGNTALLWAIKSSDLNAAEILLGHGADPNICDKFRRSPLHYAGRCAEPRLITRLIECGADIHKKSKWGSSALHFACVQGGDEIAFSKLLLDAGLELEAMNDQNRTVLSEAAKYDRKNMATFLLERGANLNVESTKGETPLMEAVIHNSSRCLSLFLSKDGPYENQSKRGNSILHLAALTGTLATLNILTQAKLRGIDIHARNVNGLTAMEIACERESSRNRRPEGFLGTFENLVLSMRDVSTTGEQKDPDNDSDVDPTEVFTDAPEF